jgi:hypothetical protein
MSPGVKQGSIHKVIAVQLFNNSMRSAVFSITLINNLIAVKDHLMSVSVSGGNAVRYSATYVKNDQYCCISLRASSSGREPLFVSYENEKQLLNVDMKFDNITTGTF